MQLFWFFRFGWALSQACCGLASWVPGEVHQVVVKLEPVYGTGWDVLSRSSCGPRKLECTETGTFMLCMPV